MAYNNGITVVAEEVISGNLNDGTRGICALKGMQIVNGGQTTASIHRAARDFGADLSRVFVQGKITVVDPGRFQDVVPFISQYSNTQNKVSTSDLSANHTFHIGMERVSRREWTPQPAEPLVLMKRARGSYQTAKMREGTTPARRREFDQRYPVQQRFTKEDLAKFENGWRGEPHWVSKGAQKNFVHFMERIDRLPDGWEPAVEEYRRYVAKGILFREVQKIVRNLESITAYRINVSAYTVALLTEKTARRIDLDRIWSQQGISKTLASTIRILGSGRIPSAPRNPHDRLGNTLRNHSRLRDAGTTFETSICKSLQHLNQNWSLRSMVRKSMEPVRVGRAVKN